MKMSQMQSILAMNAAVITRHHELIDNLKYTCHKDVHPSVVNNCWKTIYKRTIIIKRLSLLQRSLKDDIKAARTSKRVYKKHAKIVSPEQVARALLYNHPLVARQADYLKEAV